MPSFDPIELVLDSDDGVSSTIGTETVATHDLVPEERADTPNQPFRGRRHLDNRYEHWPPLGSPHVLAVRPWGTGGLFISSHAVFLSFFLL